MKKRTRPGKGGFRVRDWLKSKKLDDRSQGQINLLARSYEDGMAKEDQEVGVSVVAVAIVVAVVALVVVVAGSGVLGKKW